MMYEQVGTFSQAIPLYLWLYWLIPVGVIILIGELTGRSMIRGPRRERTDQKDFAILRAERVYRMASKRRSLSRGVQVGNTRTPRYTRLHIERSIHRHRSEEFYRQLAVLTSEVSGEGGTLWVDLSSSSPN